MGLASLPPWPLPTRCRRPWRFPLLCLPVQPRQNRKADHQLFPFPPRSASVCALNCPHQVPNANRT